MHQRQPVQRMQSGSAGGRKPGLERETDPGGRASRRAHRQNSQLPVFQRNQSTQTGEFLSRLNLSTESGPLAYVN